MAPQILIKYGEREWFEIQYTDGLVDNLKLSKQLYQNWIILCKVLVDVA